MKNNMTSTAWNPPGNRLMPPPLKTREAHVRQPKFAVKTRVIDTARRAVPARDGDNNDILIPVQIQQEILDSFYDD
jgi:hypothetical protein